MLPNGHHQSSERFIKALHQIFDHPDYKALSNDAQALLWLIARQYTGFNNGMLKATLSLMQEWGWKKKLLYKCRNELVKYDWIRVCRAQHFHKQSILYALSWLDVDEPSSHVRFDDGVRSQKKRSLRF
ncbi:hypothetical protein [Photobacterium damselae]|uniref:Uncharacterized protein n=2 Tax=Photobacterium TaxID=657 RepID=A0ABD6WZH8_PHODM|nr:hypothetical protein [Photobacterium damselae]OBU38735.1 hypothetical protein AYY27_11205 [Photobacterium damselae]PSU15256.1 hypothetical protein CTM90_17375 [Photobacterium damselae]